MPTVAEERAEVERIKGGHVTVMLNVPKAVAPPSSNAMIVNPYWPRLSSLPEMFPLELSESPGGRLPLFIKYLARPTASTVLTVKSY